MQTQGNPSPEELRNQLGDSKATLAFSNMLRENLFTKNHAEQNPIPQDQPTDAPQEQPQTPQEAPQPEPIQEQPPEPVKDPIVEMEDRLSKKIDDLGKTLKDEQTTGMKKEMDEIKNTLKDLSA